MKFNLVTKITFLALFIFIVAVFLLQMFIHTQVRGIIATETDKAYALHLDTILTEIKNIQTQWEKSDTDIRTQGSLQKEILHHLQLQYKSNKFQDTFLFITDESGAIILHPYFAPGDKTLAATFTGELPTGRKKTIRYQDSTGKDFQAFVAHLPELRWTIAYSIPDQIQDEAFKNFHSYISIIMFGAFVCMGLLLVFFLSRMLKPVSKLTGAANAIAQGNIEYQIDPEGMPDDEIGSLARAFDQMQKALINNISQLQKSEFKYRSLVQYANSIILRWDRNGRVIFLNEFGQKLFGFRQEEIVGRNVVGTIIAEQGATGIELAEMINHIINTPDNYIVNEKENICRDGRRVWVQWSNNAIVDEQNNFLEVLSVGIDITQKKETEKRLQETENRYRALFESASDSLLILSEDGKCIDCNPKALELFGSSREELIKNFPRQITSHERKNGNDILIEVRLLIREALQGNPQKAEWQILSAEGNKFDVISYINCFEANSRNYIQVVLTDITRQKRMENELRQAQKMEGIGTLAGGIAHDFNNILSAILGYTELALMKTIDNPDLTKDLKQVRKASERAKELVRQILSFSRKDKQKKTILQVSLIVKEALKLLRSSIPATIEIEQDISTKAAVITDPIQIHQLIMNLCTNAYQAMVETGGRLTVAMHEVVIKDGEREDMKLAAGKYVCIQVSDTGCGMTKEVLSQIFDPFFTTKEKGRGTGLGLAVVYDIVQGHNGGITVQSEPGVGTTFEILLPVAQDKVIKKDKAPQKLQKAKGSEHIMIVDDEEAIRDLLRAILTHAGYIVEEFKNGRDAWEAFRTTADKWSLIITDQTMPLMTGEELAVNVMQLRSDVPIILCTGYSESVSIEKAQKLGIKSYLYKPLSLDELLASVQKEIKPA